MIQMERKKRGGKGWKKDTRGGGKKNPKKMNHLINGWECWLMISRGTISGPIICQKCFGLVAKGSSGGTSLLRCLNAASKISIFISHNLKEYKKPALCLLTKSVIFFFNVLIPGLSGMDKHVVWS